MCIAHQISQWGWNYLGDSVYLSGDVKYQEIVETQDEAIEGHNYYLFIVGVKYLFSEPLYAYIS